MKPPSHKPYEKISPKTPSPTAMSLSVVRFSGSSLRLASSPLKISDNTARAAYSNSPVTANKNSISMKPIKSKNKELPPYEEVPTKSESKISLEILRSKASTPELPNIPDASYDSSRTTCTFLFYPSRRALKNPTLSKPDNQPEFISQESGKVPKAANSKEAIQVQNNRSESSSKKAPRKFYNVTKRIAAVQRFPLFGSKKNFFKDNSNKQQPLNKLKRGSGKVAKKNTVPTQTIWKKTHKSTQCMVNEFLDSLKAQKMKLRSKVQKVRSLPVPRNLFTLISAQKTSAPELQCLYNKTPQQSMFYCLLSIRLSIYFAQVFENLLIY